MFGMLLNTANYTLTVQHAALAHSLYMTSGMNASRLWYHLLM